MDNDPNLPPSQELDAKAPEKVEDPHLKGLPHNLDERLSPELKEAWDKMTADKVNLERNFKVRDEELRKTQQKLTQLQQEKESAQKAEMEAQGKFKELAEAAEQRAKVLEDRLFKVEVQSNLDRELSANGALDSDVLSTVIMSKYGDELKANPANASQLVARLKEEKPLMFKSTVPVALPPKSTGQPGQDPTPNTQPTKLDATEKKNGKFVVPYSEVEAEFDKIFESKPLF